LRRVAAFSIVLGLKVASNTGIECEMRINLRQELRILCVNGKARETRQKYPSPEYSSSSGRQAARFRGAVQALSPGVNGWGLAVARIGQLLRAAPGM